MNGSELCGKRSTLANWIIALKFYFWGWSNPNISEKDSQTIDMIDKINWTWTRTHEQTNANINMFNVYVSIIDNFERLSAHYKLYTLRIDGLTNIFVFNLKRNLTRNIHITHYTALSCQRLVNPYHHNNNKSCCVCLMSSYQSYLDEDDLVLTVCSYYKLFNEVIYTEKGCQLTVKINVWNSLFGTWLASAMCSIKFIICNGEQCIAFSTHNTILSIKSWNLGFSKLYNRNERIIKVYCALYWAYFI